LPFFGLAATYGGGGSVQLLGPDAESTNFTIKVNTSDRSVSKMAGLVALGSKLRINIFRA
jgi:hypothetical protein